MKDVMKIAAVNFPAVWAGGMERCDWMPERYMEWYKDAADTDYWKDK